MVFVHKNTIYLEVIPGAGHYGRWVEYSGGSNIQVPSSGVKCFNTAEISLFLYMIVKKVREMT